MDFHQCRHDEIFADLSPEESPQFFRHSLNSEKLPIRVYFDFNTIEKGIDGKQCKQVGQIVNNGYGRVKCEEADILTPEKLQVLKQTFFNIADYVGDLIKVDRLNEPIQLQRNWGEATDLREINDTDLVVTVYLRPYGNDTVLAAASATRYEPSSGRSIQGLIYINLKEVPDEPIDINSPVRFFFDTCLHELVHVLGMSSNMFTKWINPETGSKYRPFPMKYVTFPEYEGKTFRLLQTPNAINVTQRRFNRTYFKDDALMGIEIEEKGGSGTVGSHVKGRTYYSDLMVGIVMPPTKISEITLALLEDMGWYECNWSLGEPLPWGDGESMGIQKMTNFPIIPPDYFPDHYQCLPEQNGERVCNYDFSGLSHCGAQHYIDTCPKTNIDYMTDVCDALPYYDTKGTHWFGPSDCHDFMRLLKSREYLLCSAHWTNTTDSQIADNNFMTFGKESMCSTIVGKNEVGNIIRTAGCFNTICDSSTRILTIETTKGNVTCSKKGERKSVDFMTIICPDPDLICPLKEFTTNAKVTKPTDPFSYNYSYSYTPESEITNQETETPTESKNETEEKSSDTSFVVIVIIVSSFVFIIALIILVIFFIFIRRRFKTPESPELLSKNPDENEDKVLINI